MNNSRMQLFELGDMPEDQKRVVQAAVDLAAVLKKEDPARSAEDIELYQAVAAMLFENRMREVRAELKRNPIKVVLAIPVGLAKVMVAALDCHWHTADIFDALNRECDRIGKPEFKVGGHDGEVSAGRPDTVESSGSEG